MPSRVGVLSFEYGQLGPAGNQYGSLEEMSLGAQGLYAVHVLLDRRRFKSAPIVGRRTDSGISRTCVFHRNDI